MTAYTPRRVPGARIQAQGSSCAECPKNWAGESSLRDAKAHLRATGHTIHAAVTRIEQWHPKDTGEKR